MTPRYIGHRVRHGFPSCNDQFPSPSKEVLLMEWSKEPALRYTAAPP